MKKVLGASVCVTGAGEGGGMKNVVIVFSLAGDGGGTQNNGSVPDSDDAGLVSVTLYLFNAGLRSIRFQKKSKKGKILDTYRGNL